MANQIRITPDQMRERAKQYRAEADIVNGVINKMDSLLQQLQSEWEGAASESYAVRYQELNALISECVSRQSIVWLWSCTLNHSDKSSSELINFATSSNTIFAWSCFVAVQNIFPYLYPSKLP